MSNTQQIIEFLLRTFVTCSVELFGSDEGENTLFFKMQMKPGEKFWCVTPPKGCHITKITRYGGVYSFWMEMNKTAFLASNGVANE